MHAIRRRDVELPERLPPGLPRSIHDADIDRDGNALFALGAERATYLVLASGGRATLLPTPEPLAAARVRLLGPDLMVVAKSRVATAEERNVWLIDRHGEVHSSFAAGDAIQDIVATRDRLVVTYFDEGVMAGPGLCEHGLSVFDHSGRFVWGWNESIAPSRAAHIIDCYAAVHIDGNRIAVFSYDSFELVVLDIEDRAATVHATPEELHAVHALSERDGSFFFHRQFAADVRAWCPGEPSTAADPVRHLRGLPGGRFINVRRPLRPMRLVRGERGRELSAVELVMVDDAD